MEQECKCSGKYTGEADRGTDTGVCCERRGSAQIREERRVEKGKGF